MVSVHEATLSSGDGIVLVEDLDYEAVSAAIGGAFADSAGPPGHARWREALRQQRRILLIRCAHQ
ncbi:hypothetical protein [Polymorphospora lycopeni]|uniref:Uncharacterized protein n=1 Tax=Polymorphospora lycopeni TaxID=3140240 RepID=A0ABV5CNX6_9ACTN